MENLSTEEIAELRGYKEMVERRRKSNRESAKRHYHQTMKLGDDATIEQIQIQKKRLEKRDNYQRDYYQKNKERIVIRQREYRAKLLEKQTNSVET